MSENNSPLPLAGREVVVCVCGGIAAYKTAEVVSQLAQRGCGVTVAMTRNATRFIGEVTLQALSGRPVFTTPPLILSSRVRDILLMSASKPKNPVP